MRGHLLCVCVCGGGGGGGGGGGMTFSGSKNRTGYQFPFNDSIKLIINKDRIFCIYMM